MFNTHSSPSSGDPTKIIKLSAQLWYKLSWMFLIGKIKGNISLNWARAAISQIYATTLSCRINIYATTFDLYIIVRLGSLNGVTTSSGLLNDVITSPNMTIIQE